MLNGDSCGLAIAVSLLAATAAGASNAELTRSEYLGGLGMRRLGGPIPPMAKVEKAGALDSETDLFVEKPVSQKAIGRLPVAELGYAVSHDRVVAIIVSMEPFAPAAKCEDEPRITELIKDIEERKALGAVAWERRKGPDGETLEKGWHEGVHGLSFQIESVARNDKRACTVTMWWELLEEGEGSDRADDGNPMTAAELNDALSRIDDETRSGPHPTTIPTPASPGNADGDAFADAIDKCPDVAGTRDGCPHLLDEKNGFREIRFDVPRSKVTGLKRTADVDGLECFRRKGEDARLFEKKVVDDVRYCYLGESLAEIHLVLSDARGDDCSASGVAAALCSEIGAELQYHRNDSPSGSCSATGIRVDVVIDTQRRMADCVTYACCKSSSATVMIRTTDAGVASRVAAHREQLRKSKSGL